MKLVELLAAKLEKWADTTVCYVQDPGGDVWPCKEIAYRYCGSWSGDHGLIDQSDEAKHFEKLDTCDDHENAIVTRSQWQAERDRQKGGEWKRHRGGKCPVPAGTKVSTRHRDGEVVDVHFQTAEYGTHKAVMDCVWKHDGSKHDIMAYKVISQPQAEEVEVNVFLGKNVSVEYAFGETGCNMSELDWKPLGKAIIGNIEFDDVKPDDVEHRGPFPCAPAGEVENAIEYDIEFPSGVCSVEAKTEQMETPFKWRDTVNELDAYIEEFTREREALINRLALEGFALIPAMTAVMVSSDISIPIEEWEIGDIVEVVSVSDQSGAPLGIFKITNIDSTDPKYELDDQYFPNHDQMKFVRRP